MDVGDVERRGIVVAVRRFFRVVYVMVVGRCEALTSASICGAIIENDCKGATGEGILMRLNLDHIENVM